jgi:hypothetical protein
MKASNIFQKLKTQGFGADGSKPAIPGIKTPLSMKDSPLDKALVGNQKNLPEHLKAKIEAAPPKMYKSDAQRKAVHASKDEKKSSPTTMKAKGDNGKAKEVKAQSITTDLEAGTRTRYFSEEDQKKYGVPAQVTSKIVKSAPAPAPVKKKSCSPMRMETETMAGPGNPKKAMRKAKKRATKATNVMQRAMNACKRNTRGSGSTYRN